MGSGWRCTATETPCKRSARPESHVTFEHNKAAPMRADELAPQTGRLGLEDKTACGTACAGLAIEAIPLHWYLDTETSPRQNTRLLHVLYAVQHQLPWRRVISIMKAYTIRPHRSSDTGTGWNATPKLCDRPAAVLPEERRQLHSSESSLHSVAATQGQTRQAANALCKASVSQQGGLVMANES